jgi:hypothetical protein
VNAEQRIAEEVQRTSGYAIASLILGIAGFFVFPIVLSLLAVVFAGKAREEIRATPGMSGEGLATAGLVLGWVGLVIGAIGLLVVVIVLLLIAG